MAMRSNSMFLRSVASRLTRNATVITSSTPKMEPMPGSADFVLEPETEVVPKHGEFMPVYVAIGMMMLSMGFGLFTALHQLKYAPNVYVRKSRRESFPELMEPEHAAEEGEKFIKESFFRKVGHIQEIDHKGVIPDHIRGDIYAWQPRPRIITLKDVGVDPVKDTGVDSKHGSH